MKGKKMLLRWNALVRFPDAHQPTNQPTSFFSFFSFRFFYGCQCTKMNEKRGKEVNLVQQVIGPLIGRDIRPFFCLFFSLLSLTQVTQFD
jgi:hypothetical protein